MTTLKHADFEVPSFGEFDRPPFAVPAYAQEMLALGPVAYWRLDETTGTTLADQVDNYPLTLSGAYTLSQPGAIETDTNTAVRFNGGSAVAPGPVIPTTTGAAYSLLFWLRVPAPLASGTVFVWQYENSTPGRLFALIQTDGTIQYTSVGNPNLNTSAVFGDSWRMVLVTRDASGVGSCYVDGELDVSSTNHTFGVPSVAFRLGYYFSPAPDVLLDEVAVFDRALSPSEARWAFGLATGRAALPPTF